MDTTFLGGKALKFKDHRQSLVFRLCCKRQWYSYYLKMLERLELGLGLGFCFLNVGSWV